jgi:hypothetical protein
MRRSGNGRSVKSDRDATYRRRITDEVEGLGCATDLSLGINACCVISDLRSRLLVELLIAFISVGALTSFCMCLQRRANLRNCILWVLDTLQP